MTNTVFLGGGNITNALVAGLRFARYSRPVVVYDRNQSKLQALRKEFHVGVALDLNTALSRAEILIIAVRPASVADLLAQLAESEAMPRSVLMISLAAGIPLNALRPRLGGVRWVRATPSPVCRIGRGLTALSFGRGISRRDRKLAVELFEHVGVVIELPENRLNVFNATFSPGRGYHAVETLAQAARQAGLDYKTSLAAAAHALADSISYWRESGQRLEDLMRESATPGGTTDATISAMNQSGYPRIIGRGLKAGIERARLNGTSLGARS